MRYLLVSERNPICYNIPDHDTNFFCPSCQYAYWSEDPIAQNFDCPHFTGLSENEARADQQYAIAVESADTF